MSDGIADPDLARAADATIERFVCECGCLELMAHPVFIMQYDRLSVSTSRLIPQGNKLQCFSCRRWVSRDKDGKWITSDQPQVMTLDGVKEVIAPRT